MSPPAQRKSNTPSVMGDPKGKSPASSSGAQYQTLNEHEMNFDIPINAADGFEGMDGMGQFPGADAWDLELAAMHTEHYDPSTTSYRQGSQ